MRPWILLELVAIGWAVMAFVMALLWLVQKRYGDAGIVDVAWGLGVGGLSVFFAVASSHGLAERRLLVATLAMLWALRLSGYILKRILTMPEDGRYQDLKEKWGALAQQRMFRFYQFQALGSVLFALPMLVACQSRAPLGLTDALGVLIWLIAIGGESLADRQLSHFRSDPTTEGQVCRRGLWRYSRHPNYFFEWLHWWSYVLLSWAAPWGWVTVLAPLIMLLFILYVTGIPPTEARALKSRGEAYRRYQQTTSAFFPWPPKSESVETA